MDAPIRILDGIGIGDVVSGIEQEAIGEGFPVILREHGGEVIASLEIVVMDEATASLDEQTQATFQRMIDTEFKDCTVISIAHRLNTILQCDRVCVMNDGRVAEFDSPKVLQLQDSLFRKMLTSM